MAKDIVYIDIDDEITSVINKVEQSSDKVVALVLPKRTTTFLSTVNMKLLKRAGKAAGKSIVLITSDTSILPLAGAAGLHVAKSLQAKPQVPPVPEQATDSSTISSDELDAEMNKDASGLSDTTAGGEDEVIELDNTDGAPVAATTETGKKTKNRKLLVPNFSSFRLKVFLGVFAVILLIVGWVFAFIILPKATITLKTDVTTIDSTVQFTASKDAKTIDADKALLPAVLSESKKTDTEKVTASGKKDKGTKATGTMTVYNCTDNDVVIPAGTVFSNSGYSFGSDSDATIPSSDFFSAANGGACKKNRSKVVNVTAVTAGGSSNLSAGRDYASNFVSTITGTGSAMGGGTSNIVTVVTADDINGAQQKLSGRQKTAAVADIDKQMAAVGMTPLEQTLTEGKPTFTSSAAVDAEAADVTVTAVTTYSMLGVAENDLKILVEASVNKQITDSKQKILKNGLDAKQLTLVEKKNAGEQKLSMLTVATIGPDINLGTIATEAAGKRRGDVQASLSARAGVKDVSITYNPFWVTSTPKKASKIKVVIEQNNAK